METTVHPRSGTEPAQPGSQPANPGTDTRTVNQPGTTEQNQVLPNLPAPPPVDDPARPSDDPPPEPDPKLPVQIHGKLHATTECADAMEEYDIRSDAAPPDWEYQDVAFRSTGRF